MEINLLILDRVMKENLLKILSNWRNCQVFYGALAVGVRRNVS